VRDAFGPQHGCEPASTPHPPNAYNPTGAWPWWYPPMCK
jgi:hypothetical protein